MPIANIRPRVTGKSDSEVLETIGPCLSVQISCTEILETELRKKGEKVPDPVEGHAIIDTGATMSCVDFSVVKNLGLQPLGTVDLWLRQDITTDAYSVKLTFSDEILDSVEFEDVAVVDLSGLIAPRNKIKVNFLLGRDFLKSTVLIYNGPLGCFTLAR